MQLLFLHCNTYGTVRCQVIRPRLLLWDKVITLSFAFIHKLCRTVFVWHYDCLVMMTSSLVMAICVTGATSQ
jgi:hypothetical protein